MRKIITGLVLGACVGLSSMACAASLDDIQSTLDDIQAQMMYDAMDREAAARERDFDQDLAQIERERVIADAAGDLDALRRLSARLCRMSIAVGGICLDAIPPEIIAAGKRPHPNWDPMRDAFFIDRGK